MDVIRNHETIQRSRENTLKRGAQEDVSALASHLRRLTKKVKRRPIDDPPAWCMIITNEREFMMRPTATRSMCQFEWLHLLYLRGDVTVNFFKWGRQLLYASSTMVLIEWYLTDGLICYFRFTQVFYCPVPFFTLLIGGVRLHHPSIPWRMTSRQPRHTTVLLIDPQ